MLAKNIHAGDFPRTVDGLDGENGVELIFTFVDVAPVFHSTGDLPDSVDSEGGPWG